MIRILLGPYYTSTIPLLHGGGCSSGLSRDAREKALPLKTCSGTEPSFPSPRRLLKAALSNAQGWGKGGFMWCGAFAWKGFNTVFLGLGVTHPGQYSCHDCLTAKFLAGCQNYVSLLGKFPSSYGLEFGEVPRTGQYFSQLPRSTF